MPAVHSMQHIDLNDVLKPLRRFYIYFVGVGIERELNLSSTSPPFCRKAGFCLIESLMRLSDRMY
jgi:hypothetical protein